MPRSRRRGRSRRRSPTPRRGRALAGPAEIGPGRSRGPARARAPRRCRPVALAPDRRDRAPPGGAAPRRRGRGRPIRRPAPENALLTSSFDQIWPRMLVVTWTSAGGAEHRGEPLGPRAARRRRARRSRTGCGSSGAAGPARGWSLPARRSRRSGARRRRAPRRGPATRPLPSATNDVGEVSRSGGSAASSAGAFSVTSAEVERPLELLRNARAPRGGPIRSAAELVELEALGRASALTCSRWRRARRRAARLSVHQPGGHAADGSPADHEHARVDYVGHVPPSNSSGGSRAAAGALSAA